MPIPKGIKPMPPLFKHLILQGISMAGTVHPAEDALMYSEEHLTGAEYDKAKKFLEWLHENGLTVGHGTIDLRFHEFTKKLKPVSRDEAYQYAMKQAGV